MGSPYSTQSVETGYRFSEAALSSGHQIYRIFFYHDGVHCANSLSTPPQDEDNLPELWQQLTTQYHVDVVVCVASALKRGILDQKEAERFDKDHFNLTEPFELSGLGQLIDASAHSDRVITFAS